MFCCFITIAEAQERVFFQDSIEVKSIHFEGNQSFSDGVFRNLLSTKETPAGIWTFIFKHIGENFPGAAEPKYFDYDIFNEDVQLIKQHYNNNGFFHAIVNGSYLLDSSSKKIDAQFTIAENKPSNIDSIYYKYINRLPDSVKHLINANPIVRIGSRYSEQNLHDEKIRIISILENNGYPDARSDSIIVERRFSTNNVTIIMPFYFGKRLFFGDISIKEDTTEKNRINIAAKLIYDRLDFHKGEVYSSSKREQGESNLNRLKIFSSVRITASVPPANDSLHTDVPIQIALQPKKNYEISIGPLVNNLESRLDVGAGIGFTWLNIFGAAQIFSARFQYLGNPVTRNDFFWLRLQSYRGNFNVRFDQPYLFNNQTSGFWTINYTFAQEKNKYAVDIIQNIVGMKWQFTPQLSSGTEWTLEQSEFSKIDPTLSSSVFVNFGTITAINYRNSIITLSLDRDWTNDFFNPTKGDAQRFLFEEAGLFTTILNNLNLGSSFQNAQYIKLEILSRLFHDISKESTNILAFKFKLGSIFRYGLSRKDDLPVPFTRTYYAGGSNSVRGWNSKQLAVDSTKTDIGSNALFESSLETRWNVFHEKKFLGFDLNPLWFVFFLDAGNLWNEFSLIRASEIALAVGLGVRYHTPFGPVRIDYGMRMYDPRASQNSWITQRKFFAETFSGGALHLGLAHAF